MKVFSKVFILLSILLWIILGYAISINYEGLLELVLRGACWTLFSICYFFFYLFRIDKKRRKVIIKKQQL